VAICSWEFESPLPNQELCRRSQVEGDASAKGNLWGATPHGGSKLFSPICDFLSSKDINTSDG